MPNSVPFLSESFASPSSGVPCPAFSRPGSIVVLADDITGAAEIAGIAHSHGLKTKLTTTIGSPVDGCDVLVLATDWRQMNESEAIEESRRATAFYKDYLIFKKTDSVLRGHILAECSGMLSELNDCHVVLIAQNPSKGRVVRDGLYYINENPIAETSFSFDPEFPAKSSVVTEILQNNLQDKTLIPDVRIENAETIEEINKIVTAYCLKQNACPEGKSSKTIFAGGADLFSSILSIYHNTSANLKQQREGEIKPGRSIIVCGSTQSTDISQTRFCQENDFVVTKMPEAVFHGKENPEVWTNELRKIFRDHNIILTIGHKPQGGQAYAIRLRNLMADAVKILSTDIENSVGKKCPSENNNSFERLAKCHVLSLLIIEGGATAYQILRTLGWSEFLVSKEYAPGVVALKYKTDKENVTIILKPGSYPWGNMFQ